MALAERLVSSNMAMAIRSVTFDDKIQALQRTVRALLENIRHTVVAPFISIGKAFDNLRTASMVEIHAIIRVISQFFQKLGHGIAVPFIAIGRFSRAVGTTFKNAWYWITHFPSRVVAEVARFFHRVGTGIANIVYTIFFLMKVVALIAMTALVLWLAYEGISYIIRKRHEKIEQERARLLEQQWRIEAERRAEASRRAAQRLHEEQQQRQAEEARRQRRQRQEKEDHKLREEQAKREAEQAQEQRRRREEVRKKQEQIAFNAWRTWCRDLLQQPQHVTRLPQPPKSSCTEAGCAEASRHLDICSHGLSKLYCSLSLSFAKLRNEQRFWHPNNAALNQVPEPYKEDVFKMSHEISQVLQVLVKDAEQRCR